MDMHYTTSPEGENRCSECQQMCPPEYPCDCCRPPAHVGPSSEWEPLYRAEKRRADAAEAEVERLRDDAEVDASLLRSVIAAREHVDRVHADTRAALDAAEAKLAEVRAISGAPRCPDGGMDCHCDCVDAAEVRRILDAP